MPSRLSSSSQLPSIVNRIFMTVESPAVPEPIQSGPSLLPANLGGMRQLRQPPLSRTELKISPHVIHPPKQDRAGPVDFPRRALPDRSQCLGLAKRPLIGLA